MEFDIVEWIEMAQDRIGWCAGVNWWIFEFQKMRRIPWLTEGLIINNRVSSLSTLRSSDMESPSLNNPVFNQ